MQTFHSSESEDQRRAEFVKLFRDCPIPENELMANLGMFIKRQDMTRILFMDELYRQIVDVFGIVVEFGTKWGQNMALFESFRGIYEPYYKRKLVGFDTFAGFPHIEQQDGDSKIASVGNLATTPGYEDYLAAVLDYHESESPCGHLKKYELIKGDAGVEIVSYLERYPETIIAMAYFDFDLYRPTVKCLEAISGHITRGTVIGFDNLNSRDFPGETLAVKHVLGLNKYAIRRSRYSSAPGYIVVE